MDSIQVDITRVKSEEFIQGWVQFLRDRAFSWQGQIFWLYLYV